MYENPDKIAIALYFASKTGGNTTPVSYKPFPTIHHIYHEVFVFAIKYNFLKVYGYEQGQYMPYSSLVAEGINENFEYNPVFDNYECKIDYDLELDNWLQKNKEYKKELFAIRDLCEQYTAPELYLVLHEHEKPYIKSIRKKDSDPDKYRNQINKTLGGMRYNWWDGYKITKEKYEKIKLLFDQII